MLKVAGSEEKDSMTAAVWSENVVNSCEDLWKIAANDYISFPL
jgi:hypothetical protein